MTIFLMRCDFKYGSFYCRLVVSCHCHQKLQLKKILFFHQVTVDLRLIPKSFPWAVAQRSLFVIKNTWWTCATVDEGVRPTDPFDSTNLMPGSCRRCSPLGQFAGLEYEVSSLYIVISIHIYIAHTWVYTKHDVCNWIYCIFFKYIPYSLLMSGCGGPAISRILLDEQIHTLPCILFP